MTIFSHIQCRDIWLLKLYTILYYTITNVSELTKSGLSLLHRYGMSLTCINMPFRLTMITAPSTDCYSNGSKVRFQPVQTPKTCVLEEPEGVLGFTFGSGSRRNPIANVTIMTITADSKPAIWEGPNRHVRLQWEGMPRCHISWIKERTFRLLELISLLVNVIYLWLSFLKIKFSIQCYLMTTDRRISWCHLIVRSPEHFLRSCTIVCLFFN